MVNLIQVFSKFHITSTKSQIKLNLQKEKEIMTCSTLLKVVGWWAAIISRGRLKPDADRSVDAVRSN